MTDTPYRTHPVHDSISLHNIRSVAVVDDAFDPVSLASLQEGEEQEFINVVNDDDNLIRALRGIVWNSDSDDLLQTTELTDQAVERLWSAGRDDPALGPVLKTTLFRVLDEKIAQVERLCTLLKDGLHIKDIKRYGTGQRLPRKSFQLAFIDYRFGPSRQPDSVRRAIDWAAHLYRNGQALIILMSSEPEAIVRQDWFRRHSGLTRGLFEFLDKAEVRDDGKFCNRLNSFCAGLGTRHQIHKFATAVETAVDGAISALKQSIHDLGLEDYAYLEQISLREDGHPLGDYMLWLFGEYFAHSLAVSEPLQPARTAVNGLKYERFLPLQRPPSVMLAKMYSAAITEPVHEGWGPHPRDAGHGGAEQGVGALAEEGALSTATSPAEGPSSLTLEDPTSEQSSGEQPRSAKGMPLYQLGDLLVADETKPALLILNAGCDLQFSPGGERDCDVDQSILLVPGRFEHLHERGPENNVKRTELFELGEKRYRIVWQHTRAIAIPYHQLRDKYEPEKYERRSRLKMAFALEVQQHFAAQLTRVGVPTPTPVFRERLVEVYGKDAQGNCCSLGTVENGVIVFHHRKRDQFVLTVDCTHAVLDLVDRFIAAVDAEIQSATIAAAVPQRSDRGTDSAELATETPDAVQASSDGGKKPPLRDPVQEAAKKAVRRKKYLKDLRDSRAMLARGCDFQNMLTDLPLLYETVSLSEAITETTTQERVAIKHAPKLSGAFQGGAALVLAFSLIDHDDANDNETAPVLPDRLPVFSESEERKSK